MKASSYLPGGQRQDTGQRKSNTSSRRQNVSALSPPIPPEPSTETTTPSVHPYLINHLDCCQPNGQSRYGPRVGPNARNATTSLLPVCWRGVSLGTRG